MSGIRWSSDRRRRQISAVGADGAPFRRYPESQIFAFDLAAPYVPPPCAMVAIGMTSAACCRVNPQNSLNFSRLRQLTIV